MQQNNCILEVEREYLECTVVVCAIWELRVESVRVNTFHLQQAHRVGQARQGRGNRKIKIIVSPVREKKKKGSKKRLTKQ